MPTTNPITPFIARQGALVLDGGLATELERRGADLADALWSARLLADDPALIRQVHLDYYWAGARCSCARLRPVRISSCAAADFGAR